MEPDLWQFNKWRLFGHFKGCAVIGIKCIMQDKVNDERQLNHTCCGILDHTVKIGCCFTSSA